MSALSSNLSSPAFSTLQQSKSPPMKYSDSQKTNNNVQDKDDNNEKKKKNHGSTKNMINSRLFNGQKELHKKSNTKEKSMRDRLFTLKFGEELPQMNENSSLLLDNSDNNNNYYNHQRNINSQSAKETVATMTTMGTWRRYRSRRTVLISSRSCCVRR